MTVLEVLEIFATLDKLPPVTLADCDLVEREIRERQKFNDQFYSDWEKQEAQKYR